MMRNDTPVSSKNASWNTLEVGTGSFVLES
ncbi:Uncharacterised protein [Segatella copri]|nr:Uncharacterised protein [Segatella copri]